jgi:orotate phosphoribosyltransferase
MLNTGSRLSTAVDCEPEHIKESCLTHMDERAELRHIIARESVLVSEEGFVLASGKRSKYYYDVKRTTLSLPHALASAARLMLAEINALQEPVQAVGGLTSGADPLVVAISLAALIEGRNLPGFFVRDKAKGHGTERLIEGVLEPGMNVVIVDDVITQGNSVYKAIQGAEDQGARVVHVFILVDREEGGTPFLRDKGYKIKSLFTHSELTPLAGKQT